MNRKGPIALYVPTLVCGGAERVALLLAEALERAGEQVHLLVADCRGDWATKVPDGVTLVDLRGGRPIRAMPQLARYMSSQRPRAIVSFGSHTAIATYLSSVLWRWRTPRVARVENNLTEEWRGDSLLNRLIGPALFRRVARTTPTIAVSQALADQVATLTGASRRDIATICNPVFDVASFEQSPSPARHPWLLDRSRPTLVAMGRLVHQKGFDVLIDAFSLLAQCHADVRLVVFGEGELRAPLQAQIDRLGLGDRVSLAGHSADPIAEMSAAAAFVLSSRFEGFGLVVVEALRAGTRIVSTDCPFGPAEILEGGRFGRLVVNEDAQALAMAMHDAITSNDWCERPDSAWFSRYSADESAREHLRIINMAIGSE